MRIQNNEAKEKLSQRLNRIEGQIRGVQGMIKEERDCREIIQQLTAIQSALQSVSRLFLQEYATACLVELGKEADELKDANIKEKLEKIVLELITLLNKA